VLKAEVAGLVHKSDAGPVQLDLHGRCEGRAGYHDVPDDRSARLTRIHLTPAQNAGPCLRKLR